MGGSAGGSLSPAGARAIGAGLALLVLLLLGSGALQQAAQAPAAALAVAAALVGSGWLASRPALRAAREPTWLLGLGLLLGCALLAVLAWRERSVVVEGRRWFWLEDDAMVSMRYARRWAQGLGFTWSAGPPVEGYSNFLWTVLMGLVHRIQPDPALAPAYILGLNIAVFVWLALAVRRLAAALGADALGAALAGLACAFSADMLGGVLQGMEGPAVAAVAAESFAALAAARRAGRSAPYAAMLWASLLPLLRADGALPAALISLLFLRHCGRDRGRFLRGLVLAFAPALVHLAWRHAYYGAWLPNTVSLKSGVWPGKFSGGFWKAWQGLAAYPLVALAALAVWRGRLPWLGLLGVLFVYCVWTGPDYFHHLRYFAAAWPLLFALGYSALPRLAVPLRWRVVLPWLLFFGGCGYGWNLPELLQGSWSFAADRIKVALELSRRVLPGERVACAWAGTFFYVSGCEGVDLLGKCDPVVARAPVDPAVTIPGHNRMHLGWSLGVLRPEWVLSELPVDNGRGLEAASFDLKLYTYPLFVRHCLPQAEVLEGRWALCRCRWDGA